MPSPPLRSPASRISRHLPDVGAFSFGINLRLDATVVAFTIALMLIAILATGLAPGLYASSPDLAQVLSGEIVVGGTRKRVRRNALVIVQVAVCTLVLVGMGLCQRNLYNLRHVDPGFSARNLVAVMVYPKLMDNPTEAQARGVPGNSAHGRSPPCLAWNRFRWRRMCRCSAVIQIPVQFPENGNKIPIAHTVVDADYFATLGIRVLAGRAFNSRDREGTPDAIVINRKMAELFWPGRDPVGTLRDRWRSRAQEHLWWESSRTASTRISTSPRARSSTTPLSQHYQAAVNVIARTKGDPRLWVEPLAQSLRGLGLQALAPPATFDNWMNLTLLAERITAGCVAALSGLGLLLAIIGLFGAISYSVSERKKELGIRVALGAQPWQLLEMVLRQTLADRGRGSRHWDPARRRRDDAPSLAVL